VPSTTGNPEGQTRLALFYTSRSDPTTQGQPFNAEPDKCAKVDWFPMDMVPHNTVPYTAAGIDLYRQDRRVLIAGWRPLANSGADR
jgi:hypothetical protein